MPDHTKKLSLGSLWESARPTAVLTLLCAVMCLLLVGAYHLTYVDTTGVLTDKLRDGCVAIFGESEYEMLTDPVPEGITSVIADKANGVCAFEIYASGYSKDGLHVLVGMDKDGAVAGVYVVSTTETPGLGTKVDSESFLSQFTGQSDPDLEVDAITGATFSSKGVRNAVSLAIQTYQNEKEAIFR